MVLNPSATLKEIQGWGEAQPGTNGKVTATFKFTGRDRLGETGLNPVKREAGTEPVCIVQKRKWYRKPKEKGPLLQSEKKQRNHVTIPGMGEREAGVCGGEVRESRHNRSPSL